MGKTAFSGPVYGAKSLLYSAFVGAQSSASSMTRALTIVPSYEDWYATEAVFQCSSCSTGAASASSVALFSIRKGTTNLNTPVPLDSTDTARLVTITADAGEYEGKRIPAGSTVGFHVDGGDTAVAIGSARCELRGFIRYIDSTRAS